MVENISANKSIQYSTVIPVLAKFVRTKILNPAVAFLSPSTSVARMEADNKFEPKTLYIFADNGQRYTNPRDLSDVESRIANNEYILLDYDHHGVELPPGIKEMVGSELVLHNLDYIIDCINLCAANGYKVVIGSHISSYDPDAAISQFLIKEILVGNITKDNIPSIYKELAQYANVTDYYKFPYVNNPEFTLRGILDGLYEKYQNDPKALTENTDKILSWAVENRLDPNDFNKFGGRMMDKNLPDIFNEGIESRRKAGEDVIMKLDTKNVFTINVKNKYGEVVPLKVMFCNDPTLNGKAIDDLCYAQSEPYLVVKKVKTNEGKEQWWIGMRADKYRGPDGNIRSDNIDKFKEQITNAIEARFGGKDYFKNYPSISMFKVDELRSPITLEELKNTLSNPELAKFAKEEETGKALREELIKKFGMDKVAGFSKGTLKYLTDLMLKKTSFTDIIVNISLKNINDAVIKDASGKEIDGHDRGDIALKKTEENIYKWAKEQNLSVQVFRDGANFIVRCQGAKPAYLYMEELQKNVANVSIDGRNWKTKPKLGWISCDRNEGKFNSTDEYMSFLNEVINQINAGKTGYFEPSGKIDVKAPKAIAFRQDLMEEALDKIKGLYPELSDEAALKLSRDAYILQYIEPDSGLLNANAFEHDYNKMVAEGKKSSLFFFDGDKFSAWSKSYGSFFGNKAVELILADRLFKAGREVFDKYGITFYRHGSRSEEFYLLGEGVDMETMNKAVAEFGEAINKSLITDIPVEDIDTMPSTGKELLKHYIRENPGSVKDGRVTVDLVTMLRGINAKYMGISLTGKGAVVLNEATIGSLKKEAEAQKSAMTKAARTVRSTIWYLEQGTPGGTFNYKVVGTFSSTASSGLMGFLVEAPFSILHQICDEGNFSHEKFLSDCEKSGVGWAEFGVIKGAIQNLLSYGQKAATNSAIFIQTLWQLKAASPEQRSLALASGATGLGGFMSGAWLFNFIPAGKYLRGFVNMVGGVAASKASNEMFMFAYRNSAVFRDAVDSEAMKFMGNIGAESSAPLTGYYTGELVTSAFGYGMRDYISKGVGEKILKFTKFGTRVGGAVGFAASLKYLPLNPAAANEGNYEGGIQAFTDNQMTMAGQPHPLASMDISSNMFKDLFSKTNDTHAPQLAQETALILMDLGYLQKPDDVSDSEWEDLTQALATGTLDDYLKNDSKGSFMAEVRDGLTHFQRDLIKWGMKVNAGRFDADTCRYLMLAYTLKNPSAVENTR